MWEHYLEAVPALRPVWRSASARLAYLLVGDRGAVLTHPASAIAHIELSTSGVVTVRREPAFESVPDAMLLIMLRRILWHAPRDRPGDSIASVVVRFDDDDRSYRLFACGRIPRPFRLAIAPGNLRSASRVTTRCAPRPWRSSSRWGSTR